MNMAATAVADLEAIKARQQAAWSSGDYALIGALNEAGQAALESDLLALVWQFNRSADVSMVVPSEYLEIVVTRR